VINYKIFISKIILVAFEDTQNKTDFELFTLH